jgi:hypothetical protein
MLIGTACTEIATAPGGAAPNPAYAANPAQAPSQPQPHPIRDLFASTIAAVLQTTSAGLVSGISGGILNWFAAKTGQNASPGYATAGYPNSATQYPGGYPSTNSYPDSGSQYPSSSYPPASSYPSGTTQYPGNSYPTTASSPGTTSQYPGSSYPPTSSYPSGDAQYPSANDSNADGYAGSNSAYSSGAAQVYNASTGQLVMGENNPYAVASASDSSIYAGIAYEIHALSADDHWVPINPATYEFRSGDRFMVYYRPSLPGRMQVYNVNPAGQQTLIDSTDMAAGQMAGLGPYEFTNLTGDESLRLLLTPCSTPQLLVATRDIVKANVPAPSNVQTGGGVNLSACDATTARAIHIARRRDIQKVALDGTTSFALDPVSGQELASGLVDSREVTIVFHHR